MLAAFPARAARPLLDSGKWDNYFALFARNTSLPWKRITLRLDTYSGAPVDFAVYDVDPTDVLVAGANARPRAIDTAHRKPVARWRFTPPPGLTLTSSDVEVPLLNHEGFFVVEARRGSAVQQVWLNISGIGLLTKETPGGSIVYGADLATGRSFHGMRVTYLVGTHFVYDVTDAHGISRVPPHAVFAIAEWAASKAFVSLFPQSPPPAAVIGVRADRASVRAGEAVRVVGFARRRNGNQYRPAAGEVALTVVARGKTLASAHAALDRTGAYAAKLDVPADAPAGDAAILATAAGANGGATIHIDGVGDTALTIAAQCSTNCPPAAPIPLTVNARRDGVAAAGAPVRVRIVRSPHVQPPGANDDAPAWGVTTVLDAKMDTDAQGAAHVTIPAPSDGLPSTYGVVATSGASSASANLVAPTARVALAVTPVHDQIDPSEAASFDVRGFDAVDGSPAAGLDVKVRLTHGPTEQNAAVTLGADGTARVTFHNVALGMNLVSAQAADPSGATAVDVAAVTVAPRALSGESAGGSDEVRIAVLPKRQKPGERTGISASLRGATGDALVTMESVRGVTTAVVPTVNGTASATLPVPETIGAVAVGVAFVRDGALVTSAQPLVLDGPGHQRQIALSADRASYAPSATAKIAIADGGDTSDATVVVRVSDRRATSGASFDDIPGVLASAGTTTQNLASTDPAWHTWVAPAKSTASDIFGFDRPTQNAPTDAIAAAETHVYTWHIEHGSLSSLDVALPAERGRYVLSIIKITDDGDVGAASIALTVQ